MQPDPVTVRSHRRYAFYLWFLTILYAAAALGTWLRALSWASLIPEEPTLLALFLPTFFFVALAGWIGRWALFHSTARIKVTSEGLAMTSAIATDTLPWEKVEALHLQGFSGSEIQLRGKGHRVTLPSGSATPAETTLRVQDWITYRLNDRELDYRNVHFWGP